MEWLPLSHHLGKVGALYLGVLNESDYNVFMRRSIGAISAIAILICLSGCKSRHDQVIGMWVEVATRGNISFNHDHTYWQVAPVATGTWSIRNDEVHIKIKYFGEQTLDEYLVSVVKSRGKDPGDQESIDYIDKMRSVFQDVAYTLSTDGKTLTPVHVSNITSGPLVKTSDDVPN
jgi:hypothetical protein